MTARQKSVFPQGPKNQLVFCRFVTPIYTRNLQPAYEAVIRTFDLKQGYGHSPNTPFRPLTKGIQSSYLGHWAGRGASVTPPSGRTHSTPAGRSRGTSDSRGTSSYRRHRLGKEKTHSHLLCTFLKSRFHLEC